jgi:hypothetical protein
MTTFESVLAGLARDGVRFVVVGGLAVLRAGFVRLTEDVDILIEATEANVRSFLASIEAFSPAAASLSPADFPLEEGALRFAESFSVDVFTLMSGHTYADLLAQSEAYDVRGESVRFLGAEGLIRLKKDSLRPKDQIDVDALRAILRGESPT